MTVSLEATGASLARWLAPYGIHYESRGADAGLLTDDGLEVRWHLSEMGGAFHVSRAERAGPQHLVMIALDLEDAERFLVYAYGSGLRRKLLRDAPWLQIPFRSEDLASGFEIAPSHGGPLAAALQEGRRTRAFFNSLMRPTDAVAFSHIANHSVGVIKGAFLHPTGAPIFIPKTHPQPAPPPRPRRL